MTPTWPVIKENDARQYHRVTRRDVRNRNYIRCECNDTDMDGESVNFGVSGEKYLTDITEYVGRNYWNYWKCELDTMIIRHFAAINKQG